MTLILTSFMTEYIHWKLMNDTNSMEVSETVAELLQNNWDKNLSYLMFYLAQYVPNEPCSPVFNFAG